MKLLTVREVAAMLRVSPNHVYELARRGELPGVVRLGKTVRVDEAKLMAWLERGGWHQGEGA